MWTTRSRPSEGAGGVEKTEPMLLVPIGAGTETASSGRLSRAAREAGRKPAAVEPVAAALDMAAVKAAAAAAAVRVLGFGSGSDRNLALIPCKIISFGEPAQPSRGGLSHYI